MVLRIVCKFVSWHSGRVCLVFSTRISSEIQDAQFYLCEIYSPLKRQIRRIILPVLDWFTPWSFKMHSSTCVTVIHPSSVKMHSSACVRCTPSWSVISKMIRSWQHDIATPYPKTKTERHRQRTTNSLVGRTTRQWSITGCALVCLSLERSGSESVINQACSGWDPSCHSPVPV